MAKFLLGSREGEPGTSALLVVYFCVFVILICGVINNLNVDTFIDETVPFNRAMLFLSTIPLRIKAIIGTVAVFLMTWAGTTRSLQQIRFNYPIAILWITITLLMIVAGIFHQIGNGYLITQFAILILFPTLYLVWAGNGKLASFYDMIAWAFVTMILVLTCLLLILYPWDMSVRYSPIGKNTSILGFLAAGGVIASLYLCIRLTKWLWLLPAISLGFAYAILYSTMARSSFVTTLLITVMWIVFYIKKRLKFKQLLITTLIAIMVFVGFNSGIQYQYALKTEQAPISFSLPAEFAMAEDQITKEPTKYSVFTRIFQVDWNNPDSVTNGRVGIWKIFWRYLNLTGNDVKLSLPIRVKNYSGTGYQHFVRCHNAAYDVAFRAGVPAGILYLLMELIMLIYAISRLFVKGDQLRDSDIFASMALTAFFVIGLVDTMEWPFWRELTFMYYMAMIPVLTWHKTTRNSQKESSYESESA